MSDKAKLLLGFGFMLTVIIIAVIAFNNSKHDAELLRKHANKTVGIYTGVVGKFHARQYGYVVKNKLYWNTIGDSHLPKGIDTLAFLNEMYEVRYLPSDPEISQINFLKRFEEKELYGVETKGKIDVIHWIPSEKHWLVRYSYDKNGKQIKSKQAYRYWDTSNVKAGRRIKVKYSSFREGKDLPERSWIIPGKEPAE